jgi:hypothetical protein
VSWFYLIVLISFSLASNTQEVGSHYGVQPQNALTLLLAGFSAGILENIWFFHLLENAEL